MSEELGDRGRRQAVKWEQVLEDTDTPIAMAAMFVCSVEFKSVIQGPFYTFLCGSVN